MSIVNWLKSRFSCRAKALSLYRRGMKRAQRQDHQGAIVDYGATIDMPNGPPDVKAMALYNRALIYAANGDHKKATDDLNMVLALPTSPTDVKTEARRKLERMRRQSSKMNVKQLAGIK
jgi:hypothetical protein